MSSPVVLTVHTTYVFPIVVHHTAICVHGYEFHFTKAKGLYAKKLGKRKRERRLRSKRRKEVMLGTTDLSKKQIEHLINYWKVEKFRKDNYRLLRNNCNHFSDLFAAVLCKDGVKFPTWINWEGNLFALYFRLV